ncbi:MAG: translocation/assembly module TamB domain-containing protein [Pseudomonadota bacterium]
MLRRTLRFLVLSFALLLLTPAHSEMSLSASSSLDSFNYDLDNIHLKLEKLSARWQLSPANDGKLQIAQLKAKRLILTLRDDASNTKDSPLPNRINLPFPISIEQADITELVIITSDKRQTLSNVKFSFDGNKKSLCLKLTRADTPWGDAAATLSLGTAKPFPLAGEVSLKQLSGHTPYDVKALLSGDLKTLHFESTAWLAQQNGKLALMQGSNSPTQAVAHIVADGQLNIAKDYPITIDAHITEFHPERLGNYPAALLNFDLNLQGTLQPTPNAKLEIIAKNSQWQGQPLSATGNLLLAGTQIQHLDFEAGIDTNHIQANGSLGSPDSHLTWKADLPNLTVLGKEYAGEVHSEGTLDGTFDNLALHFNLAAQKLKFSNNFKVEKLAGLATLTAGENGKAEGDITASAISYGQHAPINAHATLQGTRASHQIVVSAQGLDPQQDLKFESILKGGLATDKVSAKTYWQGFLQQLTITGESPLKLTAPAPLRIASDSVSLEQASLQLNQGRVYINSLQAANNKLVSQGHLEQFSLKDLPADLLHLPSTLQGNPTFSGQWDINAADTLNGKLSLWREAGDFTFSTANNAASPLDLKEAKLDIAITNNQAVLTTKIEGDQLGKLNAQLGTTLTKTDAGFALLASAPLALNGTAQLQTLAWLPLPTSLMDADIDGQLNLTVIGDGTLGKPNLSGDVIGKNLHLAIPSEGLNLSNGSLQAAFQNDQLLIKQASWQGGTGSLKVSGLMLLDNGKPKIDLNWTADKFTALSRADRLLILSGSGQTILTDGVLSIQGKFTVDKGLIELANEDAPVLGDDVVILGQSTTIKEPALLILLNGLHVDLGNDFILRGRGLDAELIGGLTMTGLTQYHPHTEGSIQVKKGTYMAYGQVLNIERGILNFSGPMDNPGLNIRAMRNSKPINAGVEITGSAFIPVTLLVSDPNVPETEKLSWLVLGHGMDQAGKNDYGMLSLAAGVLLSQGQSVPLQTQLARAAGLDEFSFSGGDAESASLVFGKRLTSKLYLSYVKSITGLLDVARLTFTISPRWSLRAEAGTESAVDVLYTFSFK